MVPLTPPFPFVPGEFRIRVATQTWELQGCRRLRRAVFCEEQKLFDRDDRDAVDHEAVSLAALTCMLGMPEGVAGTVRIHQLEPGVWQGSRLAVDADFRRLASLGTALIQHAVGVARARGCGRFVAQVQAQNVELFRRLHWRTLDEVSVRGKPHHWMAADLDRYPPREGDQVLFLAAQRRAA